MVLFKETETNWVEPLVFFCRDPDAAIICCAMQVRPDWETVKIDVMYRALKCKFSIYPHLNSMLLSTAGSVLVEASPHDLFWGGGRDGEGLNYLGRLLMQLRSEFLGESFNIRWEVFPSSMISEERETIKREIKTGIMCRFPFCNIIIMHIIIVLIASTDKL